jgi:hypothetical protein
MAALSIPMCVEACAERIDAKQKVNRDGSHVPTLISYSR